MASLTICSWNVNGLRATVRTGDFPAWLDSTRPDIAGFQEVKAAPGQVDSATWESLGYTAWWHPADRPGYSGALLLSRTPLDAVRLGIGIDEFDREGRVIEADLGLLTIISAYFPNGGRRAERLDFKLAFHEAFLAHVEGLRARGRQVLFMGDLNVAHTPIDIARPEENERSTGFLPVERAWLDRVLARGYADTFRALNPAARDIYTYWEPWRDRRARNIGWRIDYVVVSADLLPAVETAFVEATVMGSDHCPVGVRLTRLT